MKEFTHYILICVVAACWFSATKGSAYDLTLAWDANSEPDLAGYKLYGSEEGPCGLYDEIDDYTLAELDPTDPMCTVTDLENDRRYHFVVTAYDTAGNESDYSNIVYAVNGSGGAAICSGTNRSSLTNSDGGGGGSG